MIRCTCGRTLSADYVAMVDECPSCGASPVPDAQNVAQDPAHENVCSCCGDAPATNDDWCEACVEFLWEGSDA